MATPVISAENNEIFYNESANYSEKEISKMSFGNKRTRMVQGRAFWTRGYCVNTVGLNEEKIREYARNQECKDILEKETRG